MWRRRQKEKNCVTLKVGKESKHEGVCACGVFTYHQIASYTCLVNVAPLYIERVPQATHFFLNQTIFVPLVGTTESEYIGTRNTITGLSYDSELTRGHETLTGAPTAALRRRKRLDEEIVSKTSDIQDGSSKLGLLEILDLAKVIINLEHVK